MTAILAAHDLLLRLLAALAGAILAALTVLIGLDVLLRNTGAGTLFWLNEVVEYGLYAATFLAAPWVLHKGAHVRMDLLVTLLPPRLAHALDCLADLLGCLICLFLLRYALRATSTAFERGSLVVKTLALPEWWLLAPIPLCFALLAVGFLRRLLRGA